MPEDDLVLFELSLPRGTLAMVTELAEKDGMTEEEWLRHAVVDALALRREDFAD